MQVCAVRGLALNTAYIGPIRQVMVRGIKKVDQVFMMAMAAYNLVRMRTLGQIRLEVA
jgi:hypothetical protein